MDKKGEFWLSINTEEKFYGSIGFDLERGYYLEIINNNISITGLFGFFIKGGTIDEGGYCINGIVEGDKKVSLIIAKQIIKKKVYFYYYFEGGHFNNLTEVKSKKYTFKYKNIENWVTSNGANFEEESQFDYIYKAQKLKIENIDPVLFFEKDSLRIYLHYSLSTSLGQGDKDFRITDSNYFSLESDEEIEFATFVKKKAEIYNFIKLFSGSFFQPQTTYFKIGSETIRLETSDELLSKHEKYSRESVINYSENKNDYKKYFENFVELFENDQIKDIISLYYNTVWLDGKSVTGNNRFLSFCQILEGYYSSTYRHRLKFEESETTKLNNLWKNFLNSQNEQVKDDLKYYFTANNNIPFKEKLLDYAINELSFINILEQYSFSNGRDFKNRKSAGVNLIVNTRNKLTHHNSDKKTLPKSKTGICSEYLQSIFETLLLKDLGVSEELLKEIWDPKSSSHIRRRVDVYYW